MTITMQIATGSTDEQRRQLMRDTLDYRYMPVPVSFYCETEGCPGHMWGPEDFPIADFTCEGCGYELVKWEEI